MKTVKAWLVERAVDNYLDRDDHPSMADLVAFGKGQKEKRVLQHVESCPLCLVNVVRIKDSLGPGS